MSRLDDDSFISCTARYTDTYTSGRDRLIRAYDVPPSAPTFGIRSPVRYWVSYNSLLKDLRQRSQVAVAFEPIAMRVLCVYRENQYCLIKLYPV